MGGCVQEVHEAVDARRISSSLGRLRGPRCYLVVEVRKDLGRTVPVEEGLTVEQEDGRVAVRSS